MTNPGKFSLKLGLACFVLAAMFCTAAQAQNVSEVSHIDLGGGIRLDSVLTSRQDPDPADIFLVLSGVTDNPQQPTFNSSVTIRGRGFPASATTPAGMTAVTTVLATYGVLAGTVTPNYASYVAANLDQVRVDFSFGDPDRPIINGGAFNGKTVLSPFAFSKSADVASPQIYKDLFANGGLVSQFNIANPFVAVLNQNQACAGIATQFDVDSNGNLLIRVFQGNDAPFPGVSVIVSVTSTTGTAQFEAVSDANVLAQFNGPGNTVALNSQNKITGISLQFSNDGAATMCVVQGNPDPPCDTSTAPAAVAQTTAAP